MWNLLAQGMTQKEVSKELGVSHVTIMRHINKSLEKIRGWAGRQAEDWRNQQLLILSDQISAIVKDTDIKPLPLFDEDGEQMFSKAGYPLWEVSPEAAAKQRNMARVTLQKYLKHQADLLSLTVERKEIMVDQKVAIGVYDFGTFDGAASLEDI
ncbi:MAG: hypothetical protein GWN94_00785 [Phycisphaerae bacterium]|nr:hypothetical protein [Phycisphaerae bacterium]